MYGYGNGHLNGCKLMHLGWVKGTKKVQQMGSIELHQTLAVQVKGKFLAVLCSTCVSVFAQGHGNVPLGLVNQPVHGQMNPGRYEILYVD